MLAGGMAVAPRPAWAENGSRSLGDEWFASVARAESLMSAVSACGAVDSTQRAAVAEQMWIGVHVLGSVVQATLAADTLLATPFAMVRRPEPHPGWGSRVLRTTGVISAAASLVQLLGAVSGVDPQTRRVLAYVGGSAAGVGGVLNRWASRPQQEMEPFERSRALDLETDLRYSIDETEHAAEWLWADLRRMALDSCETDPQVVELARRYANALQQTSVIVDSRVARSRSAARSCAEWRGFAPESRERCEALASHLDRVAAQWQEVRWLIERSKRNTFDFLVLADRP